MENPSGKDKNTTTHGLTLFLLILKGAVGSWGFGKLPPSSITAGQAGRADES
jgi:hypothetical protein